MVTYLFKLARYDFIPKVSKFPCIDQAKSDKS